MGRFSLPVWGFLLLCCLAVATEAEYLKYKDPKQPIGARIKDLMKRMTLAEKIGQMTQINRDVATPDVMKNYFIGKITDILILGYFSSTIHMLLGLLQIFMLLFLLLVVFFMV